MGNSRKRGTKMKKIMLIEDEELILQGLKSILDWEKMGMQIVHMAHNGREALDLFAQEPVDIVITDINMPVMDGIDFLTHLRKTQERARCIILTGYDEFEYARCAIKLGVEDYILKPIDEEKLQSAVLLAARKLDELDKKKEGNIDDKIGWLQFLRGALSEEEAKRYLELLPVLDKEDMVYPAVMKLDIGSLQKARMTDILVELHEAGKQIRAIYLSTDSLLLLLFGKEMTHEHARELLTGLQDEIESRYGILSFIGVANPFTDYAALPRAWQEAGKLQKYQVIEGYGSCISTEQIHNRKSEDIVIDSTLLRKMILQKDKEGAQNYIEDLFINNVKKEATVDDLYRMCIKIAILLQEIKEEYKLLEKENMQNLTEMIDRIFQAVDVFGIRTLFMSEIAEIIAYLHEENSQYTPVVKQIMAEVQKNYRDDMNLKTLSYKYHMNASYLGQIFQKEVGCSFAQYLSNTKNGIAKDLILNTNMKINDIAREVGYPDTSYFYRKFKQCYGVSPASLREMKKY